MAFIARSDRSPSSFSPVAATIPRRRSQSNGTYTLDNIGGDPLPATLDQEQGYLLEVTAGAITLNSNGTFSDTYTLRETTGTDVTETPIPCSGTWTQSHWGNLGLPAVHKR